MGNVHPSVSMPLSSGLAAVPLAVAHTHNPRVVVGDRRRGEVTFPDFNGVGFGNGRPKVSLRAA
jgi:hypothetical protein